MMHEIIVDPGNLHKVFYCIVFDRLVVGKKPIKLRLKTVMK